MKGLSHYICISAIIIALCCSCSEFDEDYSMSKSDLLTLPCDTLNLDTLISSEGSRTYHFTIYNKQSKGITIKTISLREKENSAFRINVNGYYINESEEQNIRVRSKDSIKIWIEATPLKTGKTAPQQVTDCLTFNLESGAVQQMYINAWGQDMITLNNVVFQADTTLTDSFPYHVYGDMTIAEGATLTINPGCSFYFHDNANLIVAGKIISKGIQNREIVFRGDRLDKMFTEQSYDLIPGRWGGIHILSSSYGNVFEYCDIHSGSYGIKCDSSDIDIEKLKIENSVIHNVQGDGLNFTNCQSFIGNSQITNSQGNTVTLYGGSSTFVHCTIANFYPFVGKTGKTLYLYNSKNAKPFPMEKADFLNCIVTGSSDDEIFCYFLADETVASNYFFRNCLLTVDSVIDEKHFQQIIWDCPTNKTWGSSNFKKFNTAKLTFDFRLDSMSNAIGKGDISVTEKYYPLDKNGVNRLSDNHSDMGCYEFVPTN